MLFKKFSIKVNKQQILKGIFITSKHRLCNNLEINCFLRGLNFVEV